MKTKFRHRGIEGRRETVLITVYIYNIFWRKQDILLAYLIGKSYRGVWGRRGDGKRGRENEEERN